jgi:hypothetical protein
MKKLLPMLWDVTQGVYDNKHKVIFWYSDYGGETDVSLNCGHFYGPIVHPHTRMNKWMGEWMKWMSERNFFFLIFGNVDTTVEWYWRENRRTRRKTCPSATLSTANPTGLTQVWTRAATVKGRRQTAWATAQPTQGNKFCEPNFSGGKVPSAKIR